MNRAGFALLELIVILVIMGTLLSIVSLNFNTMQRKSQIESQTRELFTNLNSARTESIYRKTRHRFTFEPGSYVFKRYSSDNEAYTAGTTVVSRNVSYQITKEGGQDITDSAVEFDARGFVTGANFSSPNLTLRINPVDSGAAYNCIVIHTARTNLGKMENGSCIFK